jgi:uncharacterized protein
MKKLSGALLAVSVTVALILITGQTSVAKSRYITIGTGGPTGVYFAAGNIICRLVHKEASKARKKGRKDGIRCAAPSTAGSIHNIAEIIAGELEFGVAQSDWQFHASNGSGKWEGRKQTSLRAVFSIHPEPLQIITTPKSRIKGWDDLKGKRVNIGNTGSGQRGTMDLLLKADSMSKDDFSLAAELSSTKQSTALCKGEIDAYVYTVGVPNAGVAAAVKGCGARIVNFNNKLAKSLVTKERPYYSWTKIPKGTYKTLKTDVITFGVMATLVTSSEVPEQIVYEVVRAVMENIEDFSDLHPAFTRLKPRDMMKNGLSAPLHPGAIRYYKEKGWM